MSTLENEDVNSRKWASQVNLFQPEDDVTRRMSVRLFELLRKKKGSTTTSSEAPMEEEEDEGMEKDSERQNSTSDTQNKRQRNYRGDYLKFERDVSVSKKFVGENSSSSVSFNALFNYSPNIYISFFTDSADKRLPSTIIPYK